MFLIFFIFGAVTDVIAENDWMETPAQYRERKLMRKQRKNRKPKDTECLTQNLQQRNVSPQRRKKRRKKRFRYQGKYLPTTK